MTRRHYFTHKCDVCGKDVQSDRIKIGIHNRTMSHKQAERAKVKPKYPYQKEWLEAEK